MSCPTCDVTSLANVVTFKSHIFWRLQNCPASVEEQTVDRNSQCGPGQTNNNKQVSNKLKLDPGVPEENMDASFMKTVVMTRTR